MKKKDIFIRYVYILNYVNLEYNIQKKLDLLVELFYFVFFFY